MTAPAPPTPNSLRDLALASPDKNVSFVLHILARAQEHEQTRSLADLIAESLAYSGGRRAALGGRS